MLTTLQVKNLALVENIRITFEPGLNIITGETGAGKSILVGALGLVLGGRADKSMIRSGEEACGAQAVFELPDPSDVDAILDEYGLDPCADGQLVVRRVVKVSGANQNLVNDNPVTLQVMKRLGECLVDMHGPHDHQSLLRTDAQLEILDAFAHLWDARGEYETLYAEMRQLETRRLQLEGDGQDTAEQIDLLSYRIKEIEEAALQEGEEEEVQKEHALLGNAQRVQELAGDILRALGDGDGCAFDAITGVRKAMEELSRLLPDARAWCGEAELIAQRLQELNMDIQRVVEGIDGSPVRLEWLDGRLATYQKMKRKYGPTVKDVLATLEQSKQRLHDLETRGEQLAALDVEIKKAREAVEHCGRELRKSRKAAAKRLATAIKKELKALGLAQGDFAVSFEDVEPKASGMDEIDFGFAPNVGEPMRPLRVIASSGEISRVMLAIKTVVASHDRIPILVFDEIDTNVGGEMAGAVGQKLAEVAQGHQVICITHLPQVAVSGNSHYAVAKYVRDGRTFSRVDRLDEDQKVEEVARMLGGRDLTSVALEHARQMLQGTP